MAFSRRHALAGIGEAVCCPSLIAGVGAWLDGVGVASMKMQGVGVAQLVGPKSVKVLCNSIGIGGCSKVVSTH
ncbi:hypothetical protein E2562_016512 [Oryza meyeriana var. granulata]|uniref:Uncharacterized protein n=1 Tax=Oryza meyeriana var. granulata TaxID=110450 RepID=A0A6G1C712_9ORYZ|nr:hypothetical protein E2562_016512 [Oryza meyeriana var. granulata]